MNVIPPRTTSDLAIPPQDISDKVTYVARIEDVFPCDTEDHLRDPTKTLEDAELIRIQIGNINGFGHSAQVYTPAQFKEFKRRMGVTNPEALVGQPIITVYQKKPQDLGGWLTGLIPMNCATELTDYLTNVLGRN